ncbi:MAG TPA: hypothetical protein VJ831_01270 [Jatrophihabitantaceae bacterium]|nr:hypothetical protein [Jatrophihabitantaceae bacterium]
MPVSLELLSSLGEVVSDEDELVSLELELDELPLEVSSELDVDVLLLDGVLEFAVAEECATPATRVAVVATAATAAVPPVHSSRRRVGDGVPVVVMTITIGSGASAPRHSNVKAVLRVVRPRP